MTNIIDVEEYINTHMTDDDKLKGYTLEGNWEEVQKLYNLDPKFNTTEINKSRGTALHVAVNDGNKEVVKNLVNSILSHKNEEEALKCKNEKGDTPLHLAASRGFKDICECIIGEGGERKYLIDIDNNNGETPLFLAALSWQKQTFVYLIKFKPGRSDCGGNYSYTKDLIRSNGDSILHCAIRREFFDLALIIIHKYPDLIVIQNKLGFSPLKLLATRPSAFKSGYKMIWWKKILYHCIPVGTLNVDEAIEYCRLKHESKPQESCPKNYDTCYLFIDKCREYACPLICFAKPLKSFAKPRISFAKQKLQMKQTTSNAANGSKNMEEKDKGLPSERNFLPENYATCLWFLKFVYIYTLGLSGVGVEEIKKMKQKHKWSSQLLDIFMENRLFGGFTENPYESYLGTGAKPIGDVSGTDFVSAYNPNQGDNNNEDPKIAAKLKHEKAILESETAILTAARNGIVEIVEKLITKIPSSIYDLNLENKNVLLVAVENRRTNVVEALRKRFDKCNKMAIFDDLIQGVDKEENTVLHLAATKSDRDWNISGAALQMMWHIKWFKYTKRLVPEHFAVRTNKDDKTAGELFKKSHEELVQKGSEWLKDTSESCSVVAALLAGVSFATSSTVPGGNRSETGEPALEGRPAFDAFALSSVIGLCFSVTALVMFLSILTSRKEAKDFRIDMPRKLLLGLSSLFLSIIAMFVAFCSGHFFLIDQKYKHIVFLIYSVTCFPVTLYAVAQLPLYMDLLRSIVTKVPKTSDKGEEI